MNSYNTCKQSTCMRLVVKSYNQMACVVRMQSHLGASEITGTADEQQQFLHLTTGFVMHTNGQLTAHCEYDILQLSESSVSHIGKSPSSKRSSDISELSAKKESEEMKP